MNAPAPESPPPPPKKSAWFQLHFGTCVVLMLAAGALMWANLSMRLELRDSRYVKWPQYASLIDREGIVYQCRGWPWHFQDSESQVHKWKLLPGERLDPLQMAGSEANPYSPHPISPLWEDIWRHPEAWSKLHLAADLGVAVALLVVVAVLCESLIRRRGRVVPPEGRN